MMPLPMLDHRYLVPTDGSFRLRDAATKPPPDAADQEACKKKLKKRRKRFAELQDVLYAHDRWSLLCIFQAMDGAGKDSTIRAVTQGVNPSGFQVFCFKQPSAEELDHDFLWRSASRLPERGRIGIFNRSYYEEVLVVRVHPEYLGKQKLPREMSLDDLWRERFDSIRDHERHLFRNGTVVLKFFLNVSQEEQHTRFVARAEDGTKNWKFSGTDVAESRYWDDYMKAYEEMLRETSRPEAPWYCIPADDKPYMRLQVGNIIVKTLEQLPLEYPKPSKEQRDKMEKAVEELRGGRADSRER
jgi:PPK2 family polyphosphate:nucleotide phosphotransferase